MLVAVSSTWGPGSLLCQHPGLLAKLVDQLSSRRYQVAAIIHPGVWSWHGARQVRAWYAECVRRGLLLVPPEEGWRGVLAAADVVVGDHGSVTCYAAAAGKPVLLASFPAGEIEPGSPVATLAAIAPRLRPGRPYAAQLERAASAWCARQHRLIQTMITDIPGESAGAIRSLLYRLMRLSGPAAGPEVLPVPLPRPVALPGAFGGPG